MSLLGRVFEVGHVLLTPVLLLLRSVGVLRNSLRQFNEGTSLLLTSGPCSTWADSCWVRSRLGGGPLCRDTKGRVVARFLVGHELPLRIRRWVGPPIDGRVKRCSRGEDKPAAKNAPGHSRPGRASTKQRRVVLCDASVQRGFRAAQRSTAARTSRLEGIELVRPRQLAAERAHCARLLKLVALSLESQAGQTKRSGASRTCGDTKRNTVR